MFFGKKEIRFRRKSDVISRNQRSLFKLVESILTDKYIVMYARPAYHFFDVDENENSKSDIKKGREMVAHAYIDIIILEDESLKAVFGFRIDDDAENPEKWSKETKDLIYAANSAQFPLMVVPNSKAYSTMRIARAVSKFIPLKSNTSLAQTSSQTIRHIDEHEQKLALEKKNKDDPWGQGGLR